MSTAGPSQGAQHRSAQREDIPVSTPDQTAKSSLWATAKAVSWSFIGVRKGSGFQEDISRIKPYHLIGVGVVSGILFVLLLIGLVNWVVAK